MVCFQVVCDSDLMIINCITKWPGSVHDARILRESALFADLEGHPKPLSGYLLGDSGYMLREWLLTPVINPQSQKEEAYNTAHCGTRCTVERCIGVIKRRWHCLHTELRVAPAKACKVICACFVLHNRATQLHHPVPDEEDEGPDDSQQDTSAAEDASGYSHATEHARVAAAKAARDSLINNVF